MSANHSRSRCLNLAGQAVQHPGDSSPCQRLEAKCRPPPINAVPDIRPADWSCRAATAARSPRVVTALSACDGRTLAARRYRALCVAFEQELGGDLGIVDQNLIRQAAGLVLASERFQDAAVSGAEINLDALVRVSS